MKALGGAGAWPCHLLALALAALCPPAAPGASGERYIDAYNTLVLELNDRLMVSQSALFAFKSATSNDAVTQSDLWAMRKRVRELMALTYHMPPGYCDLARTNVDEAFPAGLRYQNGQLVSPSLMDGIGWNGWFTKIPGRFTESGQTVYAENFNDGPVLWEHFEELHQAIRRLRYMRGSAQWTANGERNTVQGWCAATNWPLAVSGAEASYAGHPGIVVERPPTASASGTWRFYEPSRTALLERRYAYAQLVNLSGAVEHTVMFYVIAAPLDTSPGVRAAFHPNGVDIALDRWKLWSTIGPTVSSTVRSGPFGGGPWPQPAWCAAPEPGEKSWLGYTACTWPPVLIQWHFTDYALWRPPAENDPAEDGLVDLGCECVDCIPEADPGWRDLRCGAQAIYPLGLSSGLLTGGLRLKSYVTEYEIGGARRQMFSLQTRVLWKMEHATEGWGFVCIQRPSGREVIFALRGERAGLPIEGANRYRVVKTGSYVELRFPDRRQTVHYFDPAGWLYRVGIKLGKVELKVDGYPDQWPGMRAYRDKQGQLITSNVCPFLVAVPVYTGGLVNAVRYADRRGNPLSTAEFFQGSRGYRLRDAQGSPIRETRVVYDATNGCWELWQGVTTNTGALRVARKEVRSEERDPTGALLTVRETAILNPDTPQAESNVTVRMFRAFPWGEELVEERVDAAGAESEVTRWSYHEDPADTNNYGRLKRIEEPGGGWRQYEYDIQGRERVVYAGFGQAAVGDTNACRATRYWYAGDSELAALNFPAADSADANDTRPRLEVETVGGWEIARRYCAHLPDGEETRQCVVPGAAWDAPGNLATRSVLYTNGTFAGRPRRVERPDGTRSVFRYGYDGARDWLITTNDTGAGTGDSVTSGVRTVTVVDAGQRTLRETRYDIASGLCLADLVYERDGMGRVLCISNTTEGTATFYTYGCCGPETVRDSDGITTTNHYDELRRLYAVERLGVTTFYSWNVQGQEQEVREVVAGAPDRVTRQVYDAAGRLCASVDPRGMTTRWEYATSAADGPRTVISYPDGGVQVEHYHPDGQLRAITGTAVRPLCYSYGADERGLFTVEYRGPDTNATEWVRTHANLLGQTWLTVYPDGYQEQIEFDAAGRVVADRGGVTRLTAYNDRGEAFRSGLDMDGNGTLDLAGADRITERHTRYAVVDGRPVEEVEERVYDVAGSAVPRVTAVRRRSLDGRFVWMIRGGRTNCTEIIRRAEDAARLEIRTAPDGTRTIAAFTNGLLMSVTRRGAAGALIGEERFAYDARGQCVRREDTTPNGAPRITLWEYDAGGNVTSRTVISEGLRRTIGYEYDAVGRRVRTVHPDGGISVQEYEPSGELRGQWGTRTYPARYAYDAAGRLSALYTFRAGLTNAPDVTRWEYDSRRGWLTGKVYADGAAAGFEYFPDGRLRRRTLARGVVTEYGYDAAGSVTSRWYSDGTPGVTSVLDRLGRVVAVQDGTGTRTLHYGEQEALAQETFPLSGWTVSNVWDTAGRRTRLAIRDGQGRLQHAVGYGYDDAGRLAWVSNDAWWAGYAYAGDGMMLSRVTFGNGAGGVVVAERSYDGLGRLTNLTWTTDAGPLAGFGCVHDAADQRVRCVLADGGYWVYTYDELGQLTAAERFRAEGTRVPGAQFAYGYDTIGNRAWAAAGGETREIYVANALNQYTSVGQPEVRPAAPPAAGTVFGFDGVGLGNEPGGQKQAAELYYDLDGNLTNDGRYAYAWDAENRLIEVTPLNPAAGAQRVRNTHDYLGRRVMKAVEVWNGSAWLSAGTQHLLYDQWHVIAELAGTGDSGWARTNYYVWGLDLSGTAEGAGGIGGLVCILTPDRGPLIPACDGNGNVMALFSTSGTAVAEYSYGPFGEPLRATGPEAQVNPWRFSTRYTDPETGLVMYPARPYSPTLGRFVTRDPIEEDGGLNLYGFVGNNPLAFVDPLGLALYAFDGTWNDREKMKRPTNVAKLHDVYVGKRVYMKGVGTDWCSRLIGGLTGAGGGHRIRLMYQELVSTYNTPDPTGENQKIDVIGFSRGAALARTFVNYINSRGGVELLGPDKRPTGVKCRVKIRFLGLFDTVASFGWPGNNINWGHDLSIPANVEHVRHAVALDEHRFFYPLSSVLSGPSGPEPGRDIVEQGFRGAHSDIGGGYEDSDRSNIALMWMHSEAVKVGVPFGPLPAEDTVVRNPVVHDERMWLERWLNTRRRIYYY